MTCLKFINGAPLARDCLAFLFLRKLDSLLSAQAAYLVLFAKKNTAKFQGRAKKPWTTNTHAYMDKIISSAIKCCFAGARGCWKNMPIFLNLTALFDSLTRLKKIRCRCMNWLTYSV